MSSKDIEKENIEYDFKTNLTVLDYEKIVNSWKADFPTQHTWWKTFSQFAVHVLTRMYNYENLEVNEVNYDKFIPTLEKYFLTDKEYETIVKNVGYMKRDAPTLFRETPVFKIYNMMRMWHIKPSLNDLFNMEYKVFMKFYLYSLGENFVVPLGKPEGETYVR